MDTNEESQDFEEIQEFEEVGPINLSITKIWTKKSQKLTKNQQN